jgi:hypothetical protein
MNVAIGLIAVSFDDGILSHGVLIIEWINISL